MAAPTEARQDIKISSLNLKGPSPTTSTTPKVPIKTANPVFLVGIVPKKTLLAHTVIKGTKEFIVAK